MYTHRNKKINPKFPLEIFTGAIKALDEDGKKSKEGKREVKEDTKFVLNYVTEDAKNVFVDTFVFSKAELERSHGLMEVKDCVELVLDNPSVPLFELEVFEVAIEQRHSSDQDVVDVKKQYTLGQLQQKKDNKPSTFNQYFVEKDKAIDFSTEYIKKVDPRIKYTLSISKVPLYGVNSSVFKTDE